MDDTYTDGTWFLAKARGETADKYLTGLTEEMRRNQGTLLENTRKCISMYQWGGDARNLDDSDDPNLEETCNTYNAAQNVIETTHAKVCKSRILPMPLTSGGGYLERYAAQQLGKALEGEFDENDVDQIKEDVVMDALVTAHGAGAAKVFKRNGRVVIQHVPIEDVWFDSVETRYRRPSCCYHIMPHDKFVVLEEYGKDDPDLEGTVEDRRRAILKAASETTSRAILSGSGAPCQLEVIEAWHLPSGLCEDETDEDGNVTKATHDGRHVIAIAGCTLVDEPWDGTAFPIEFYVPRKRRRSIWGLSMMFDLVASQREYEKLTKKIQSSHQKMGVAGYSAPKTANVNQREITSGTFGQCFVMEHEGQQGVTPLIIDPVPPGTYAYKESIPRDMMQSRGVSQLSAQSQLPAGMGQASGKALQVFEDFEAERLLIYHRELERWTVRLAWRVVDVAYTITADDPGATVRYRGKGGWEPIKWKEVLPKDRGDLILKVFPVSQLSKQPSARFAQLQELLNAQAITIEQFKRLYEMPDLEAENQLDTADTDIIDRNMDIMITTGRYLSPEPFDDLDLLIKRAGKMINLCRAKEVPDARLKLLRDYIEDAKGLKEQMAADAAKKAAEAAAAAVPPGPPPGAPPMGAMPSDAGMPPMPAAA